MKMIKESVGDLDAEFNGLVSEIVELGYKVNEFIEDFLYDYDPQIQEMLIDLQTAISKFE